MRNDYNLSSQRFMTELELENNLLDILLNIYNVKETSGVILKW